MQFPAPRTGLHLIRAVCGAVVALALSIPLASAQPATLPAAAPLLSPVQLQNWRAALAQSPVPQRKGCFTAHYPNAFWQDAPCVTPPDLPYRPVHAGGNAGGISSVGNGNDYVAQTLNTITSATGSFEKVSGVLNEADSGQANRYSLQLNTNFFFGSPACNTAAYPNECQAWEQFVYSNTGSLFIQYWLINYDTTCPSGWHTDGGDCWVNAPNGASYGPEPITSLAGEQLTGTASSRIDMVEISGPGGTASAVNDDSALSLVDYWINAEFNIFGDCCATRANFNSGVTINVSTQVSSGTTTAPGCAIYGTTGETNNTNLAESCSKYKGSSPKVEFTESNPPGSIWVYTGTPCSGTTCTGWQELDNNNESVRIAATGSNLYQLWNNGEIWQYDGTPCSGTTCKGWKNRFNDPNSWEIVAGGNHLYQYEDDGKLWQYVSGTAWRLLDDNTTITTMVAASGGLYELHNNGAIWQFTGSPCTDDTGSDCPGWQQIDNNAASVALAADLSNLYEMHSDGSIWKYTGTPCSAACPGWKELNNNKNALTMVAGGNALYELDTTGVIWKYTGTACTKTGCTGWQMLDNNAAAMEIAADDENNLYELHNDGSLWKWTGAACSGNSCGGWQMIDDDAWTGRIAAASGKLYELHVVLVPTARDNFCYECR